MATDLMCSPRPAAGLTSFLSACTNEHGQQTQLDPAHIDTRICAMVLPSQLSLSLSLSLSRVVALVG